MSTFSASLTPPRGVPAVPPRGRRRDHLLVSALSLLLLLLILYGSRKATLTLVAGHRLEAALVLGGIAVGCFLSQLLFARRSSLGGLVAGTVSLLVTVLHMFPSPPFDWWTAPVGCSLYTGALLLGGSLGMRQARQAGRAEARTAHQLAQRDREMGQQPAAPPSRRRSHLLSGLLTLGAVLAALLLLRLGSPALVPAPGTTTYALGTTTAYALASALLLLLAAAGSARSSLGARVTGVLLVLAGLPTFMGYQPLGLGTSPRVLPQDPTGIMVILMGILLASLGWGSHLARRQGRASQAAVLRSRET